MQNAELRNGNVIECFPRDIEFVNQFTWPDKDIMDSEFKTFIENAHLILKHKDAVFSDSRLFFTPVNIQSGGAYIGAFVKPTIGTYVEWWIARGQDDLIVRVSGSPLSGANASIAVDKNNNIVRVDSAERFSTLMKEYLDFNGRYNSVRHLCDAYSLDIAIKKLSALQ